MIAYNDAFILNLAIGVLLIAVVRCPTIAQSAAEKSARSSGARAARKTGMNSLPAGPPPRMEKLQGGIPMRKILSLVLALMLIAGMAVPALAEKPISIGVVYKQTGNPFFEAAVKGFEEAKGELGFEYVHNGPADSSNEGQIQIIEGYIQQGVDAIAISANDAAGVVSVLQEAKDKGIKVVSWDSKVNAEGRDLDISPSVAENIGRVEIEEIAKQIGGAGQIAILSAGATMDNQNTLDQVHERDPRGSSVQGHRAWSPSCTATDLTDKSYQEMQGPDQLLSDLKGVISPTTVGIAGGGHLHQGQRPDRQDQA
jgi:rhamnose transport system substrate-binding protein